MTKDLTNSPHERQNILNNRYALEKAEEYLALGGLLYQNENVFTKQQVMELFEISEVTIERYLATNAEELKGNGYRLLRGKDLQDFKRLFFGTLINEGTKTTILGIFNFRSVLNLSMLLTESIVGSRVC